MGNRSLYENRIIIAFLIISLLATAFVLKPEAALADEADDKENAILVGVYDGNEPLLFIDSSGEPKGLEVDIMNNIAKKCGLNVKYVIYDNLSDAQRNLQEKNCDLVLGIKNMDTCDSTLRKTNIIFQGSLCLVTREKDVHRALRNDIEFEKVYSAAYQINTANYSAISQISSHNIKILGTQKKVMESLFEGESDMVYAVKECAECELRKFSDGKDYSIALSNISSVDYSILLRRSDVLLYNVVVQSIDALRSSSEYDKIINKWIVDANLSEAKTRIRILLIILSALLLIGGIVFFSFYYMNRKLKSLVSEKTAEIQLRMQELEKASNLQKLLIENSKVGSMIVGSDGNILLMNPNAVKMCDINEEKKPDYVSEVPIFGKIWKTKSHDMAEPKIIKIIDRSGKRRSYRYQCIETSVNGQYAIFVEDKTYEEEEKKEQFEESKSKTLNRIIAGIAHEIKNPLTTIRTYSSLAREQGDDPEFRDAMSRYVPKEVDRISSMIEKLVNYAKPAHGQKERFECETLIDDCLGLIYVSKKKNMEINSEVEPDLMIYAEKEQIRQALINMMLNSLDSLEEKSLRLSDTGCSDNAALSISIKCYREKKNIILEVYDTGEGMTDEMIRQCTDPFYTTKAKGTGLGLALSRQLIMENGGRLEISSEYGEWTDMKMIFKEEQSEA